MTSAVFFVKVKVPGEELKDESSPLVSLGLKIGYCIHFNLSE